MIMGKKCEWWASRTARSQVVANEIEVPGAQTKGSVEALLPRAPTATTTMTTTSHPSSPPVVCLHGNEQCWHPGRAGRATNCSNLLVLLRSSSNHPVVALLLGVEKKGDKAVGRWRHYRGL